MTGPASTGTGDSDPDTNHTSCAATPSPNAVQANRPTRLVLTGTRRQYRSPDSLIPTSDPEEG